MAPFVFQAVIAGLVTFDTDETAPAGAVSSGSSLFTVQAQGEQTHITACQDGWLAYNGSCYWFGHDALKFTEAAHYCNQHNSHLIEINNAKENAFLQDHVRDMKQSHWWIGITDEVVEGYWTYYSNGADITFSAWYPGQPGAPSAGEDCAVLAYNYNFEWGDIHCDVSGHALCEKRGYTDGLQEIVG